MLRYLDGLATPEEAAILFSELAADGGRREFTVMLCRQHGRLVEVLASQQHKESFREWADTVKARVTSPAAAAEEPVVGSFPQAACGRSWRWWVAGVAASLLIAFGLAAWVLHREPAASPPLARLDQVHGEVFLVSQGARSAAQPGQEVLSGQGLQVVGEESSAVVLYPDGTRLELGADTTLSELSGSEEAGKKVVLAEGYVTAEVTPQSPDRPMVLATPHAEVVVRGTRFNLSNGTEATYLETEKGVVQLTRKSDGQSIEVPAGFNTVITSLPEPLTPQPLPPRFQTARLTLEGYWTAALSPDGRTLATTRFLRGNVELWDVATAQQRATLRGHTRRVHAAAFSPDGQTLATGGLDQTVNLWEVATGRLRATLGEQPGQVHDLAFTADGRTLVVLSSELSEDRTVTLWDLETHQQRIAPQTFSARRWAFSWDGRMLATVSRQDKTVTLWDLLTGRVRGTLLEGRPGAVLSLAFSPDGTTLAIDSTDGLVTLWEFSTGQLRGTLRRPGRKVTGMAFSPDGATLATGHQEGNVWVWDVATGKPLATLDGSTAQVYAVAFAPDGQTLLTREIRLGTPVKAGDGAVKFWDLPPEIRTDRKGD